MGENENTEETPEEAPEETPEETLEETPEETPEETGPDMPGIEARIDELEQRVNDLADALSTMAIDAEGEPGEPEVGPDEEYGEAVDLDEVAKMLGL